MFNVFNKKLIFLGSIFICLPLFSMEMNVDEEDCVESKSKKRQVTEFVQISGQNQNNFKTLPSDVAIDIISYVLEQPAKNLVELNEIICRIKFIDKHFYALCNHDRIVKLINQKKSKILEPIQELLDKSSIKNRCNQKWY